MSTFLYRSGNVTVAPNSHHSRNTASTNGLRFIRCGEEGLTMNKLTITVRIEPDGPEVTLTGRDAWTMQQLLVAGEKGCTPIDTPAPRWSGYVFNLRRIGFDIETRHEPHKGRFPGTHARYILRSQVTLTEEECEVVA
jgi:hypothetical protein